jgi:hypothetical protein
MGHNEQDASTNQPIQLQTMTTHPSEPVSSPPPDYAANQYQYQQQPQLQPQGQPMYHQTHPQGQFVQQAPGVYQQVAIPAGQPVYMSPQSTGQPMYMMPHQGMATGQQGVYVVSPQGTGQQGQPMYIMATPQSNAQPIVMAYAGNEKGATAPQAQVTQATTVVKTGGGAGSAAAGGCLGGCLGGCCGAIGGCCATCGACLVCCTVM